MTLVSRLQAQLIVLMLVSLGDLALILETPFV